MRIFAYALATLAVGCAAQTSGTLTQEESQNAGSSLGAGIEDSAGGFGAVSAGAALTGSCVVASGNVADPDGDGIPANGTLTFNCQSQAGGYTGMLTGTESIVDDQPTVAAWAFTAMANLHAALSGPLGGTIARDWQGKIVATQAAAAGPYGLHRVLDAKAVFTAASGKTVTVTEANDWTVSYTPSVAWTPGSVAVAGTVTASGTWDVTVGAHEKVATLATPTPLTVSPACPTRVTAGTVTGTYDGGAHDATITVTWTGCGARTVTVSAQ